MGESDLLVEMRGITKIFPGVVANDHVNFTLRKGEIHGLLGENGAGKTTLMRILYGLYKPDEGEIFIEGKKVNIRSPKDAISYGIAMVHQHFELIPAHTVAENVALGLRMRFLRLDEVAERIRELSKEYGLQVNPEAKVEELSVGERQRVEIIKALFRGAKILILDEPTTVLTPQEVEGLFRFMREMKSRGNSIVFITHKLYEVLKVCDRITVMRKGKVVDTVDASKVNAGILAEMMVGERVEGLERLRELSIGEDKLPVKGGEEGSKQNTVLEISDLTVYNEAGVKALDKLTIKLFAGEILGVAGIAGNGQKELVETLAGLRVPVSGKIVLMGKDITRSSPRERLEAGLGIIFDDRMGLGIVSSLSVRENLVIDKVHKHPFSRYGFLNNIFIEDFVRRIISEYSIVLPNVNVPAATLSGGNIQRLILAKVFSREPKVVVASEPTAGLDIKATAYIRSKFVEMKRKGVGVLIISTNLDELLALSDRIAVIYRGRIVGTMEAKEIDRRKIGLMMGGITSSVEEAS